MILAQKYRVHMFPSNFRPINYEQAWTRQTESLRDKQEVHGSHVSDPWKVYFDSYFTWSLCPEFQNLTDSHVSDPWKVYFDSYFTRSIWLEFKILRTLEPVCKVFPAMETGEEP